MDETLFHLINQQWTSPSLDRFMAAASSFDLWWPFLALAAVLTAWRGGERARWMLVTLALLLVVGDAVVDNPLKHALHRLRPWQAEASVRQVDLARHARPRLLALFEPVAVSVTSGPAAITTDNPHPGRSFPSSHVVNNFCAATVLALFYRRRGWLAFGPASVVAYSRIYVGAHWPSDVLISMFLAVGLAVAGTAAVRWAARRFVPRRAASPRQS